MNFNNNSRTLVLASTSTSRQNLLTRLGLAFKIVAPMVNETPKLGEAPQDLVLRLSEAKAKVGAVQFSNALVIGSDQVACIDGRILGKPGSRSGAISQLERASGRSLLFYTGVCLFDSTSGESDLACILSQVYFRSLSRSQIEGYIDREPTALDCAGSFKSEGLGVVLFQRLESDDPTALLGLPLIRLVTMLERAGVSLLAPL